MRKTKLRTVVSFFGLMLGGLLLLHVILALLAGLLGGEAVMPRILNIPELLGKLLIALAVTALWYFLTFHRKP
jgi:hypothetical protein